MMIGYALVESNKILQIVWFRVLETKRRERWQESKYFERSFFSSEKRLLLPVSARMNALVPWVLHLYLHYFTPSLFSTAGSVLSLSFQVLRF